MEGWQEASIDLDRMEHDFGDDEVFASYVTVLPYYTTTLLHYCTLALLHY